MDQLDLGVGKAVRRIRRPRRGNALFFSQPHALADFGPECNIVGDAFVLETVEHRELAAAVGRIQTPTQHLLIALDQREEWTALPVLDGRSIVRARDPFFNALLVA